MLPSYVMLHLSYLICNASVYLISIYLIFSLRYSPLCYSPLGVTPGKGLAATVIRTGTLTGT